MKKLRFLPVVGLGVIAIFLMLWLILWGVKYYGYGAVVVLACFEAALGLAPTARWLRARLDPRREAQRRLAKLAAAGCRLHLAWFEKEEEVAELGFSARICGSEGLERLWLTDIEPKPAIVGIMQSMGREGSWEGMCIDRRSGMRGLGVNGHLEQAAEGEPGELCFYTSGFRLDGSKKWLDI